MERLTKRINGIVTYYPPNCQYDTGLIAGEMEGSDIRTVLARLAAYEDTGLEPGKIGSIMDKYGRGFTAKTAAMAELQAYRALGPVKELSALVKAKDEGSAAGDSVYVLERDEYGEAVDVSGFMFLAMVGQGAILSPYIDEIEDLEGAIEDHIRTTEENMSTDLYVYPIKDVYLTRTEAEAALGGGGDG